MNKAYSLSVLVPVYNEERFVEASLKRLFEIALDPIISHLEVIAVNDGSKDKSLEILKNIEQFAKNKNKLTFILLNQPNGGKGSAIRNALSHATQDISIIHDADLEYNPKDILRIMVPFVKENADVVYGSRYLNSECIKVRKFWHTCVNKFLTFLTNMFSNAIFSDAETCYKAIKTDIFKSLDIKSNDFRLEIELSMKIAKKNIRIFEVPISYEARSASEGKKINWKDGVKALIAIFKYGLGF